MQRHPTTQKNSSGNAGYNKQIQIFRQIEKTETHPRIFCMISGGQLTFRFGKVERTTVTFGVSGNQIDNEGNHRGNVSFEDKPAISLSLYNFGELHGSHKHYHSHDTHTYGKLITDNLCTTSHRTNQRELIITAPACKQNTDNSDTGSCQHIKIQNFRSFIKRNTSESKERSDNHHKRSQIVEEMVGALRHEDFLSHHFKHVADHLDRTPFTDTVRTETALEESADFALHVNQYDSQYGI